MHVAATAIFLCIVDAGRAVIPLDTADPAANTTTPGDNAGWQYQGQWGGFLGTPIAKNYFISAAHIGQADTVFVFHGETFQVGAFSADGV